MRKENEWHSRLYRPGPTKKSVIKVLAQNPRWQKSTSPR